MSAIYFQMINSNNSIYIYIYVYTYLCYILHLLYLYRYAGNIEVDNVGKYRQKGDKYSEHEKLFDPCHGYINIYCIILSPFSVCIKFLKSW